MSSTTDTYSFSTANDLASQTFLASESMVGKLAFLLTLCLLFVFCLRVGANWVGYMVSPSDSPFLIRGMVDARQTHTFPQDPSKTGSTTIFRSVNEQDGIEFTWSVWVFINSLDTEKAQYHHIFSKGNSTLSTNGVVSPNNAPGLYLSPMTNEMTVFMNTHSSETIEEEVTIPDIPLNKWMHVVLRCENTRFDVYVNGVIARSLQLSDVPRQNYGDVYVALNGGFDGNLSNLQYFNHALSIREIDLMRMKGPNTSLFSTPGLDSKTTNYLATQWYFQPSL